MTATIRNDTASQGLDIDAAGFAQLESLLKGVTGYVVNLAAAMEGAAQTAFGFVQKTAEGLDSLYQLAQQTGASVNGINALGYAARQTGVSTEAMFSSLESMANALRNDPGAENVLTRLGIQTREADGSLRDTAALVNELGQALSDLPDGQARQIAQALGVDQKTLASMQSGMRDFSADYQAMQQATGFDADSAVRQSHAFMTSARSLTALFSMVSDKVGASLAGGMAGPLDALRENIMAIYPEIDRVLTSIVTGFISITEDFSRLVLRLIQGAGELIAWWGNLDSASQALIETVGALIVGWRLLNLAFAASPIGLVTSLISGLAAAILLLYDDFNTWREGGDSLIDWAAWQPAIEYAINAFSELGSVVTATFKKAKAFGAAILDVAGALLDFVHIDTSTFNGQWVFDQIINGAKSALQVLGSLIDAMTNVVKGDFSGAWSSLQEAAKHAVAHPVIQGGATVATTVWDKVMTLGDRVFPEHGDPLFSRTHVAAWAGITPETAAKMTDSTAIGGLAGTLTSHVGLSSMNPAWATPTEENGAHIQQQNTYNIYGGNALEIGSEIEQRQIGANAQILRKNQTRNS